MKNVIAAAVAFAAVITASPSAHGEEARLDPDTGLPATQPFKFPELGAVAPFWSKRLTGYITTSEGARLRYSVLLPRGSGKFPVALSINGYDAGSIGGSPYLKYQTAMSVELDKRLVEAGYAVMGVNAAGTGCSDGKLEYIRPQLGKHGAEVVEFAAAQDWSDGKVGMVGASYGAASQLATAQHQPAHLRAIVPAMVVTDYRHALMPGGVPQPGFLTPFRVAFRAFWSELVAQTAKEEGDTHCLEQVEKNLVAEDTNSVMNLFVSHPLRDEYMDSFDLARYADRIKVPVLSFEAFQDHAITPRGGHYQSKLDPTKLWLIQSNGRHDLHFAADFQAVTIRFFGQIRQGGGQWVRA